MALWKIIFGQIIYEILLWAIINEILFMADYLWKIIYGKFEPDKPILETFIEIIQLNHSEKGMALAIP